MQRIIIIFFLLTSSAFRAQQITNLQEFDSKKIHFGFAIGVNKGSYYIDRSPLYQFGTDSLLSIQNTAVPGMNLGIVSALKLSDNFYLRFIPTLTFFESKLDYYFYVPVDSMTVKKRSVEPVYIDFPVLFKLRTSRIKNFAAYSLIGGKYSIDVASQKDVDNINSPVKDQIIKLQKTDLALEIGGGMDLFLPYFKLGLELKLGIGLVNMLLQENTIFSSPIDKLRTRAWTFSITFEG